MDLSWLGKAIAFAVPAAAPMVAAVGAGINTIAGVVNQPQGAADSSASAATSRSGGTTASQNLANLPKKIQDVLKRVDSTVALSGISTAALEAELNARKGATKSTETATATQPTTSANANATATASNSEATTDATSSTANSAATATTVSSVAAGSNPTNAKTSMQNGQAVFENDNYIIAAGDDNNVVIYNKKTKEVYDAVGDLTMKIDGKDGFSGKGTMSLMLNDGTKVTMGREDDGKGGSLASKLTITNGAYGAQIKGISTTKTGDLAVQEFAGQGKELDDKVADGVTMEENQDININNGRGFVVKDINGAATLVSNEYLAKVMQAAVNTGNLDQFDLPGEQTSTAETNSTDDTRTQNTTEQRQTVAPPNTASTKDITDQFDRNMALKTAIDLFKNGQKATTRPTRVGGSTLPNNGVPPVRSPTENKKPALAPAVKPQPIRVAEPQPSQIFKNTPGNSDVAMARTNRLSV